MLLTNLQATDTWTAEPDSSGPHGTISILPGRKMMVQVKPALRPGGASDNFYCLKRLAQDNRFSAYQRFRYSMLWYITATDLANCQAFEFELQQSVSGQVFNMAWQADFAGLKLWRVFNYNTKAWEPTVIPVPPASLTGGYTTAFVAEFIRIGNQLTHLSLQVDSVKTPLYLSHPSTPLPVPVPDYLNIAFQPDGNSKAAPYGFTIYEMSLKLTR